MMRKSRFGSKAGRDASRDSEQDAKEDPDGSNSISNDGEAVDAEEGVDRYERSSDRYRGAASERAGAEESASARRSFGNSFAKSSDGLAGKTSGGFSSGKGSGSSFSNGKGGSSGSSFARKSSFGRSGGGSSLSSGTSKAEAIAASAAAFDETTQPDGEAVYERSSDRAFPKKRGSFGGGTLGRSSSKTASAGASVETTDTYERSSDRKFGRGGSAGSKAASAARGTALSSPAADGEDVFERSTDRNASRRNFKKPVDKKGAESTPRAADEGRVETVPDSVVAGKLSVANPDERLKRARALLEETLVQSQVAPARAAVKRQSTSVGASPEAIAAATVFDFADPFEPFEQCAPPAADAVSEGQKADSAESVYSRGSNGRGKASASGDSRRKGPQLSLRGRALGYLSRREHSRAELSRKLTPHLAEGDSLEPLLDALEREGWLSNERFVESVVHRRGARLGTSRIVNELKRNGIDETLIQDAGATLKETELTRAREVWSKKYGEPPSTPAERAKQARFLATRGFTSGVIMKVLKGGDDDFIDE